MRRETRDERRENVGRIDRDQHLTPLAFVAAVMPYLNTSIQLRHNLAHYWDLSEAKVQKQGESHWILRFTQNDEQRERKVVMPEQSPA